MKLKVSLATFAAMMLVLGCNTAPKTAAEKDQLRTDAQSTIHKMEGTDPSLRDLLNRSYGYVVFPSIGKGGLIVGGAFGRGVVYQGGSTIGTAELSQASIGAQLGGATFAEIVVFETREAMDKFRTGKFEFGADAQAVLLKSGAAGATSFRNGVAVIQMPQGGAMAGISLTGQKLKYFPCSGSTTVTETRTEEVQPTTRPSVE
jgi:lipid-binding SYLF domain-containing protein